jgi:ribosomal protein S18 acetylase RimI-like enzyme
MDDLEREIEEPAAVRIVEADLGRDEHQRAIVALLDAYSRDPMGNGGPLAEETKRRLIPGLREHPTTIVWLAYVRGTPVGVAICFRGFSTFAARPLINIHDLAVLPEQRGRGVGRSLLEAIARKAQALGCCKLTLEVLENNRKARRVYEAAGFRQATYQPDAGGALFLSKPL